MDDSGKMSWGAVGVIVLAILLVVVIAWFVILPASQGKPIGPGPAVTTTTGTGTPQEGGGELTLYGQWAYNSSYADDHGAGALICIAIPADEAQAAVDEYTKNPVFNGASPEDEELSSSIQSGAIYTDLTASLIQQYCDTGSITRGVEGANGAPAGQPFETASLSATGTFVFSNLWMEVGEYYYFIAFQDQTPADGEILPAVLYTYCTAVMTTQDEDTNKVANDKVPLYIAGDVDVFDPTNTERSYYADYGGVDDNDHGVTVTLRCDTAGDRMEMVYTYRMIPTTNATSFDWFKINGVETTFTKVSSLDVEDPRYKAAPTALATNDTYVNDLPFATYYRSSSAKGEVTFAIQYDFDADSTNAKHYFYWEGLVIGDNVHINSLANFYIVPITSSGTDAFG